MAYIWTTVSSDITGTVFAANVGDVYRYGDPATNRFVEVTVTTAGNYSNANIAPGQDPAPGVVKVVQLRSTVADVTLTDKTKAFATGIMSTVNAIIAKVNTLTGRMTAVETLAASKAAIADADLTSLTTTLSAGKINELDAQVLAGAKSYADNAALTAKNDVISQLSGVDGTQLQALNDLSAALQANADADGVIANDLLNKVDFSKTQTLTDAQAAQARANIKVDAAINAALLATIGDVTAFDPDAILATALTLN